MLVDFELYNSNGQKVWQAFHDNISVPGGANFSDTAKVMVALPPGEYTFKSGIFSAGWGTLYAWNDQGGTLSVAE